MDKQQKTVVYVFVALLLAAIIALVAVIALRKPETQVLDFTAPPFDNSAVTGVPESVDESLRYGNISVEDTFSFAMCGSPTLEGNKLRVFFTCSAENDVWLLMKVYDTKGNLIGKSGMIRMGEYVEYVTLDTVPKDKNLVFKILSYEPETYYSKGSANATLPIKIISE